MDTPRKSNNVAPTINVTPLIDVLLVLLIIFMVITPMKPMKFETKIPEKPPETDKISDPNPELLVLTIDKGKKLELNSQAVEQAELGARLKAIIAERPSDRRTLFIKAPRELSYEYVVGVIDIIKGAGASPIGLQVDFL